MNEIHKKNKLTSHLLGAADPHSARTHAQYLRDARADAQTGAKGSGRGRGVSRDKSNPVGVASRVRVRAHDVCARRRSASRDKGNP